MNPIHENHFDRLPDDLLRLIFNKVLDAKSLCRCIPVSKRFASIIPQTDTIHVTIVEKSSDHKLKSEGGAYAKFMKILFSKFIAKPFQYLQHFLVTKSSSNSEALDIGSSYLPNEVLKSFNEIKSLHIQLPCQSYESGLVEGTDLLLKWKAEFGSQLESCIILGATSFHREKKPMISKITQQVHDEGSGEHVGAFVLDDDELKLRVVWTLSSLVAASVRHYLLKRIIMDYPMLQSVVMTDTSKQGTLCMSQEQIGEMRNSVKSCNMGLEPLLERTRVPFLNVKLYYVPVLELPVSGAVMKGATLLVIRPVDGMRRERSDGDLLEGAFVGEEEDKVLGEAVREILKKKKMTYTMEMDSF